VRQDVLKTSTIREFDGGWNVIDNDLNLSSKFAKILQNMYRSADGANTVRFGTKLFGHLNIQLPTTGSLGTDPLTTTVSTTAVSVGIASESDTALSVLAVPAGAIPVGIATEVDTALPAFATAPLRITIPAETDTVPPLEIRQLRSVVRVEHVAHGFISGHSVTFAGLTALNGLTAAQFNQSHTVTVIDADTYFIIVGGGATSTGTGGGSAGTFSHDNKTLNQDVINMVYFQDRLMIVVANGNVLEMDSNGVTRIVFDAAIARRLIGAPLPWSATSFVSFAVFGGQLIICNGIDKPLLADFTVTAPTQPVQYLVDIPSGSNLNVPIARYVLAMDNYVLMVGDPLDVGLVHVSNRNSSGTWVGDAAPNDATTVALDKVITSSNFTIRGISRHREFVVVAFDDNVVLGTLNIFDETTNAHTPDFTDVIEQHGSISHRALQPLGNDLLMNDLIGVPSLARALFTGAIRPNRVSELIDPEIQEALLGLNVGSTEDRVFAVYNQVEGQYMLFIPNADTIGGTTETQCFVYTAISSIKLKAWSLFKGWNFSCAARSALNRIFFGSGKKVFVYGARVDPFFGDFINDTDIADPPNGTPVAFIWELPWADFDKRMNSKKTRYIGFDTTGTARFTAKMFVDNIYEDKANPGTLLPTLSMAFTGGGSPGFGGGGQPYGGGRRTIDERLWAWVAKFKIAKLRFEGSSTDPLAFVAITLAYHDGSIRR